MEEMDPVVRQENDEDIKPEPSHWYEGHISLEDAKTFIKSNITTAARSFITIGFYLKCVRDRGLFTEDNYQDVWEFAKSEYGISKSTASRYMSMNDRFSENGNSPNIKMEYRAFGKSQLQEMLYLEDEQLDQVKPGDRVEDIRDLRRSKEIPYIELPGQMDFEIDFPDILPPDQIEQPVMLQKQTFEMNVVDLLSGEGQESVAISQQEQDQEPEETQDRTAYVKEQYRLQDSFLNPFAVWLIKNHKTWFTEDHMNRVIKVDKSEGQLKSYLGTYPDGSSSYGFPVDNETYYAKLYDNRIVISHFTDGGTVVVDGTVEWFYLAASIQAQWNVVALEEAQQERRVKEDSGPGLFNTDPTSCPHRNECSCTIPFENRTVPGNGNNCGSSCCWSCKFHGACKLECNVSAGRDGTIPEYDAAWFVNEWGKREPEELQGVLKECKEQKNNADRAKAVQKYLAPYGYHGKSCGEYDFTFRGFAGGIDLKIGKVDTHLKYGRFVQELLNLYPDFEKTVSKESENVIEKLENVPEQEESVPESSESVIDGVYEEVLSEQRIPDYSPRYFLEEQKEKLNNYLRIAKGKELLPAEVKTIECQKTIVAALACMVAELEKPEPDPDPQPVKQEQPELPILKNNDQRVAFVDAYETWPLWIETKETRERYYRYDLPNGTSMVVKVYHAQLFDYKATGKKYEDRYYEGYGKHEYYYLQAGKCFRDCQTNRSYLIEKLKELQKNK